jgi:hypothetical protein
MPARVAVTVSTVAPAPLSVLIVKIAVLLPDRMMTLAGSVTPSGPADTDTRSPTDGAGPLIVTVPVADPPGLIEAGLTFNETSTGGVIVNVAVFVIVLCVAVIVAVV